MHHGACAVQGRQGGLKTSTAGAKQYTGSGARGSVPPILVTYNVATVTRDPLLELCHATVVKDDRAVLDIASLTIHAGEHTAILGPNGAGKSVLMGLLMQHERPLARDNGAPPVRVLGQDRWTVFDLRAQLGFVSSALHHQFVSGNSEGRITGEAAVLSAFLSSYGILRYGEITADMRRKSAEALAAAGASHLGRRTLDQMSSGEARRVMLARALVTAPRALVLDEPTTGLDLGGRHAFMERVRHLAQAGTTVILITHHPEEIIPEVERVILLQNGRVAGDGSPETMLTPPRLTALFGMPVAVQQLGGYRYVSPE